MDVVQTRQCPEQKMFINTQEKVLTIEKSVATNLELALQQQQQQQEDALSAWL